MSNFREYPLAAGLPMQIDVLTGDVDDLTNHFNARDWAGALRCTIKARRTLEELAADLFALERVLRAGVLT